MKCLGRNSQDDQRAPDIEGDDTTIVEPEQNNGWELRLLFECNLADQWSSFVPYYRSAPSRSRPVQNHTSHIYPRGKVHVGKNNEVCMILKSSCPQI